MNDDTSSSFNDDASSSFNDDAFSSFDETELSEEDLAVLRAFDALEDVGLPSDKSASPPSEAGAQQSTTATGKQEQSEPSPEDEEAEMLAIFLEEATEDITRLHDALSPEQQEKAGTQTLTEKQEAERDKTQFRIFQRTGHKLRGTAGAVGYQALSMVAQHIELLSEQVNNGLLTAQQTRPAIAKAIEVLEFCLQNMVQNGKEPEDTSFVSELEEYYHTLGLDPDHPPQQAAVAASDATAGSPSQEHGLQQDVDILMEDSQSPYTRVERQRFLTLIEHSEQLIDLHVPIEDAQRSLGQALQDLQEAQTQLQRLEQSLSQLILQDQETQEHDQRFIEQTSSSLIARILASSEASTHIQQHHQQHPKSKPERKETARSRGAENWDELDIEHYTTRDLLLRSLREAIVEVSRCSARAQLAQTALQIAQQTYIEQVTGMRKDVQRMRQVSFDILLPQLRLLIDASKQTRRQPVQLEVKGEQTKLDLEILQKLAVPLLEMFQTCINDPADQEENGQQTQQNTIRLTISKIADEILIEIDFSMAIHGGAIEILHDAMEQLHGTLHFPRATSGNTLCFQLRFPATQDSVHSLIVRSGTQRMLITINQIQSIDIAGPEQTVQCYTLQQLLGQSYTDEVPAGSATELRPVLLVAPTISADPVGILVDEVETETEVIIRPLKSYLQRPGISGSAIDGHGNVLLSLDLATLLHTYNAQTARSQHQTGQQQSYQTRRKPRILIADDSAYLRLTVMNMLPQNRYEVTEARDGRETLEQLWEQAPDICLLDIEMPNLNGFDILTLMQAEPTLQRTKAIILTSRTSEKHRERAFMLGAQGYLTKPCGQEELLAAIEELLNTSHFYEHATGKLRLDADD